MLASSSPSSRTLHVRNTYIVIYQKDCYSLFKLHKILPYRLAGRKIRGLSHARQDLLRPKTPDNEIPWLNS